MKSRLRTRGAARHELQRTVHIVAEVSALLSVPFLFWAADRTTHPLARDGLRSMAVSTLLVDSWLLYQWFKE